MIKGIICDLDDTLYSFADIRQEAYKKMSEKAVCICNIEQNDFDRAYLEGKKQIKEEMTGNQAAQHSRLLYCQRALELLEINPVCYAEQLHQIFWEEIFQRMRLRAGVKELFFYAKEKGLKIGICTDMQTAIQFEKIRRLGLTEDVDAVVTSEEVGVEKPELLIFQKTLQKLKIKSEECLYIGDSYEKDIKGALNCGMEVIWLKDTLSENQCESEEYVIVESLNEILAHLQRRIEK